MKVVHIKDLEDCFDGSFMKEIQLERPLTLTDLESLGTGGVLEYFPDFPRPFYKIDYPDKFSLKGVEGNTTARLILYRRNLKESYEHFITEISKI